MGDSTNPGGAADFRGSREEKRQDETVVINSDNLSDMVIQAKGAGAASAPIGAPTPTSTGPNMIYIGVGVALILIVVIALVFYSFD